MDVKNLAGIGVLAAGLAAGMTVAQKAAQVVPVAQAGVTNESTAGAPLGTETPSTESRVGFADAKPISLDRRAKDGSFESGVLLYNPHCAAETVELRPELIDRNARSLPVTLSPVDSKETWTIPSGAYKSIPFRISANGTGNSNEAQSGWFEAVKAALISDPMNYGSWTSHLPARGWLVLARTTKTGKTPECTTSLLPDIQKEMIVEPPLPSSVDTGTVLASLFLSAAVTFVATAIILASRELFLRARMGDVAFDFASSWGANVAVGAGILTALTNGAILSQEKYSSNSTAYLVLAGIFAALVPVGAALYGLIRPTEPLTTGSTQPQGYVSMYLLSSGIVLWGAFGQLLLLGMVLRELTLARILDPVPSLILIVMTKGLIVLLVIYAVVTALETVSYSSEKPSKGASGKDPVGATERPQVSMI